MMLCDSQTLLKVICSYSQIVFCGWKSLHLWSTHMNFTSLWLMIMMFKYFLLWHNSNSKSCTLYKNNLSSVLVSFQQSQQLEAASWEHNCEKRFSEQNSRKYFFNLIQLVRTQLWINFLRTKFKKNFSNLNKVVRTQLWISILRTKFKKIFSYLNKLVRTQMWKSIFGT